MKKNIYILGLLFLCMILFSGRAYAITCSNGNDNNASGTNYCIQYLIDHLVGTSSPPAHVIVTSQPDNVLALTSSPPTRLYSLIKDTMLFDFVFKFIMIFGVGYLVGNHIFKR